MAGGGTIDLQMNGFAGVDFNDDALTTAGLAKACEQLRTGGVAGILATIITDTQPAMSGRLSAIARACDEDESVAQMVQGIHVEGPFISAEPGYVGAHPIAATCDADPAMMEQLLQAADGRVKLVTLAPERDPGFAVTRMLAERGIRVSAGHCNPSLKVLSDAIDAGLSMFTHLGNGCPLEMHRHDNIIQRVLHLANQLGDDRFWIGLIADGVHLPPMALANYLKLIGPGHAFVVTDAIAAAGMGPGTYELAGQTVVVDQQLGTWAEDRSHLIGSAGTMNHAHGVLKNQLGLSDDAILRLTRDNPRRIIDSAC